MESYPPRRVVTGHNAEGRSIIISDTPPKRETYMAHHALRAREYWNTRSTPVLIERHAEEPPENGTVLPPPPNGTRIRVCDFEPESVAIHVTDREATLAEFEKVGGRAAYSGNQSCAHPMMHRTQTVDYGIVLMGEIFLVLDESETLLRAGDIVIQVGTNHAWSNRSNKVCRVAFVLVDGKFDAGLAG